jgi:hypothetical protein
MSGRLRLLGACGVLVVVLLPSSAAVAAPNWGVGLSPGSGETQADGAPPAPTGATASCTSPTGDTGEITWDPVAEATGYTIYSSTTSSTDGFAPVATGVVGTAWTTPALATGTYWFEVAASLGTYWASPSSSATPPVTVGATTCT